ncbi:MAG: zinc-binding dehydrogenase [Acidimicrobiales bacterium]
MRACVMREGRLVVDEVSDPRPGPGQLLVRTLACGICGSDLHFLRYAPTLVDLSVQLSTSLGDLAPMLAPAIDLNRDIIMGHEFCAEVLEAGPDTAGPDPGTPVVSVPVLLSDKGVSQLAYNNDFPGGFSERFILSAPFALPVPNGLEPRIAALTEPLAVGVHAVEAAAMTKGHSACVVGCGPVGLAVIAALKLKGVEMIVASDFSPARRSHAKALGATEVVDPKEEPLLEAWRRLDGRSQLVCFEAVGVPGILDELTRDAPLASTIVIVGVCMEPDTTRPFFASAKELCLKYVFAYTPEEFARTLRHLAEGEVDVSAMITGSVDLEGTPGAFDELAHPDNHVKILVEPTGG